MKVITYNICCGNPEGDHAVSARAPRLKKVLDQYDADLIGLQEATPVWMEYLERDFGDRYEIFNRYRSSTNFESTPLLWKREAFDFLDKGYFWLSDTPDIESQGWDTYGCKRICMWVKLREKKSGVTFVYFNTHYGFSDPCQIASSKLILAHLQEMDAGAAVLTADFNMYHHSPGYKELRKAFADVNVETVKDEGTTFHGYNVNHTGSLIDFCFVTPETVRCVSSKRLTEQVDGQFVSDHYGVLSEIELKQSVQVMSFNLSCCGREDVAGGPTERARRARALLLKYQPDIAGFQEATPRLMEKLGTAAGYEYALQYRGEKSLEGTPVFWKTSVFEKEEVEHFWLSDTPDQESKGWDASYLRICTMVVLKHRYSDRRIVIFNTHFDFTSACHINSAALLRQKAEKYMAQYPVLFTADYNMFIGGDGYRAMREFTKDLRREAAPGDYTPTTRWFGGAQDMREEKIIDYVFAGGKEIKPLSYQVIPGLWKNKEISDHNAVLVKFVME